MFKDIVESMFFGDTVTDGNFEEFFRENEFSGCKNNGEKWRILFEKCEEWEKEYLLWEEKTYIDGIGGFYSDIHICKFRIPTDMDNLKEHIYRMLLLFVVNEMEKSEKKQLVANQDIYYNLFFISEIFDIEPNICVITQVQWLDEIKEYINMAYNRYKKSLHLNKKFYMDMAQNYQKCEIILKSLRENVDKCEIIRIGNLYTNEDIWYFVKEEDYLYLLSIRDIM